MIEFNHISKVFNDGTKAIDDMTMKIDEGKLIVFIGTSGSGKTTSMRMINRMIEPSEGEILINGENIKSQNPVQLRRKIGYVIQRTGLMPHMTIYENIVTVPRLLKWDEEKNQELAKRLIKRVDLSEDLLERYPEELSGGQQQRIGVIRALAADPKIILMDEPFGALDPITRDSLQDLVMDLQKESGKTVIFVTHDMDEALKLADKIAIMSHGKVIQFDTPENILRNPANEFVEEFIGEERLMQARPDTHTVDEVMIEDFVSIAADASLKSAIKLMRDKRVDTLFIVDELNVLKGVVGFEEINEGRKRALTVSEIMMEEVYFVKTNSYLRDTLDRMLKRGFKNIPVVDDQERLVGLVTRASLVDIVYDTIWGEEDGLLSQTLEVDTSEKKKREENDD